jgi:hypothetical protein
MLYFYIHMFYKTKLGLETRLESQLSVVLELVVVVIVQASNFKL